MPNLINSRKNQNKSAEIYKMMKQTLKRKHVIQKHNEEALKNPEHPRATYKEPTALIVICANASIAYTTENGVKVVPIGCLRD